MVENACLAREAGARPVCRRSVHRACWRCFALPFSYSVRVPAILRASADAQIFPPIPSEIVKVSVKEGEFVTKGQLLFPDALPAARKG